MGNADQVERWKRATRVLHDAAKPMRVLAALTWSAATRDEFLASGGQKLPTPIYKPIDPSPVINGVAAARKELQAGHVVDDWLAREARAIEVTALMLSTLGTADFHTYSKELYGVPTTPLRHDPATPLQLAEKIHTAIADLRVAGLHRSPVRSITSEEVAAQLRAGIAEQFGNEGPKVLIVEELSANAVASTSRIKIRRDAQFTKKDIAQLLHHEAFIHAATGMNGRNQTDIPILGLGHPGTTRTQEGLAVYAEYVSGTLDLDRLRRLADRIFAVQMAIEGANFIDVYRWFLERSATPEQAYESTRRNFRGGPVTGFAPFTKDCCYLSGFLGVQTFFRAAFRFGRADAAALLFAGKLDLWAIPALAELRRQGLVKPAKFLPPWAQDPSWVLSHLTVQSFAASIDLSAVIDAVGEILRALPRVEIELPA